MWGFQNRRSALHEQLLLAPESNPSEFVRRYLANKQAQNERARRSLPGNRNLSDKSTDTSLAERIGSVRTHVRNKIRPQSLVRA